MNDPRDTQEFKMLPESLKGIISREYDRMEQQAIIKNENSKNVGSDDFLDEDSNNTDINQEEDEKRKKIIIFGIAGAIALIGAGIIIYKTRKK